MQQKPFVASNIQRMLLVVVALIGTGLIAVCAWFLFGRTLPANDVTSRLGRGGRILNLLLPATAQRGERMCRVTQKQLKLFSWNVNGIRALEKKGFSNWLQSCGADIVMLQETKCNPEQLPGALCSPPGYHADW